jgi:hypothetical protein
MTNHKTNKDGSIDYAHYMQRGRVARSHTAHAFVKSIWAWVKGLMLPTPAPQQISPPVLIASSEPMAKPQYKTAA